MVFKAYMLKLKLLKLYFKITLKNLTNCLFSAGQLYSQHLKKRPAVFFTKEGQPKDDDSYMGYSVTSGNFTGDSEGGIAAGMPRGKELVGKVKLNFLSDSNAIKILALISKLFNLLLSNRPTDSHKNQTSFF